MFVTDDAADYIDKLNFLGAAGMEVAMAYMQGIDVVMSLYEALTGGGRGATIAHTIINYRDQNELEQWFLSATPNALGPMFMTLISEAKDFTITDVSTDSASREKKFTYDKQQMHLLQQQALEKILGWIVINAKNTGTLTQAQAQFEEACASMNKFGTEDPDRGQAYCEQRLAMDNFMSEAVLRLVDERNNLMRSRYKKHVAELGARQDGFCQRFTHYGRTYLPAGRATYMGPAK
jgi:hypothetical protein